MEKHFSMISILVGIFDRNAPKGTFISMLNKLALSLIGEKMEKGN